MIKVIHQKQIRKSRNEYSCDAWEFLSECYDDFRRTGQLSFSEWRAIAVAKATKGKVFKGQPYVYQFNEQDGITYTFRAIPAIHAICVRFNLYDI